MKFVSRKFVFACGAFITASVLVAVGKISGGEWAGVCGAIATVYLGGQAYVDKAAGQ